MTKRRPHSPPPHAGKTAAERRPDSAAASCAAASCAAPSCATPLFGRARRAARIWLGAILVLLFASRFANLQYQGFHHDESIHSLYAWRIAHTGGPSTYRYDPVYHGPFMYHFGAVFQYLLPDTEYVARVPFATSGVVMVLLFLLWRRELGTGASLLTMTFLVLSAIVDYFSRFAREDVHMTAWLSGAIVTGTLYLLTSRVRFLTAAAWFVALSYCTKESSYVNNFALCSFLVLWAIVRIVRDPRNGLHDVFVRHVPLTRFMIVYACLSVFTFAYVAIDSRVGPQTPLTEGIGKILSHSTAVKEKADGSVFKGESGYFTAPGRDGAHRSYLRTAFAVSLALLLATELLSLLLDTAGSSPAWRIPLLALIAAGFYGLLAWKILSLESWLATPDRLFRISPGHFACELARRAAVAFGSLAVAALAFLVPDVVRFAMKRPPGASSAEGASPASESFFAAVRETARLWRERVLGLWGLALQVMGAAFVYLLLFSSVGTNLPDGMKSGLYNYLAYWFKHQTGEYRIWGVWWYHIPRLLLFDLLPLVLILVLSAVFVSRAVSAWRGVAGFGAPFGRRRPAPSSRKDSPSPVLAREGAVPRDERIWRPVPLPLLFFAAYLAIYMLVTYALLNEKVPWLGISQSFALNLLAALLAAHWMATRQPESRTAGRAPSPAFPLLRTSGYVFFGLLACFAVGQHLTTVFFRPDYPEELLTFTQTTHGFAQEMRRIDRERLQAQARGNKLRLSVKGAAEWPCCWYFRNDDARYRTTDPTRDIQITEDTADERRRIQPAQGNVWDIETCVMRGWWHWSGNVEGLPGGDRFLKNLRAFVLNSPNDCFDKFPAGERPDESEYVTGFRDQVLRYVFFREIWYPTGGLRVLIGRKTDKTIAPEVSDITLKGVERPLISALVLGFYGVGPPDPIRLTQPRGVAVTREGEIAVVDSGNGRVLVLSPDPEILFEFGKGVLSTNYSGAGGVAVDSQGNFLVADTWNHAVRRFSPDGRLLKTVAGGIAGGQTVGFYGPRGIAVGPDGRIYVTDTGNKAIRVFDADLTPLLSWGVPGDAPGSFDEPVGIAVDAEGDVFVADTGNGRVQQFDSEGRFKTQFLTVKPSQEETIRAEPYLTALRNGKIALTMSITDSFWVIDPKEKRVVLYEIENPKVADPIGVAQSADGTLWITDREGGKLFHVKLPIFETIP